MEVTPKKQPVSIFCNFPAGQCEEDTPAVHYCTVCKESLCVACYAQHSKGRISGTHRTKPIQPPKNRALAKLYTIIIEKALVTNGETDFTCADLSDEMVNRDIGTEPTRLSNAKIRSMLRTLNKSDVVKVVKSRAAENAISVTLHPCLVRWAEVVDFPLSARLAQWAKVVKFDRAVLQPSALILADSDADLKVFSADIH